MEMGFVFSFITVRLHSCILFIFIIMCNKTLSGTINLRNLTSGRKEKVASAAAWESLQFGRASACRDPGNMRPFGLARPKAPERRDTELWGRI